MDNTEQIQTAVFLKTAVSYLASVLDEGSLVPHYDEGTRREIAAVLTNLLEKVDHLPDGTPEHLVQATAVRAIIQAQEQIEQNKTIGDPEANKRKAELAFSVQGHRLGDWQTNDGKEYEAICEYCQGVVYANASGYYGFQLKSYEDQCSTAESALDEDTLLALWDMDAA